MISVVPDVVSEHAAEAAHLRHVRSTLVRAPHAGLDELLRHDGRIAAHLDGLAVAAEVGSGVCAAALAEAPGTAPAFVAAVNAIEARDTQRIEALLALAEENAAVRTGLMSALGWVPAAQLQGQVATLLGAKLAVRRTIGLAACAMHQANPGTALTRAIADPDPLLQACALRVAGELGRGDLAEACVGALRTDDPALRFWAARSALLLGARDPAIKPLEALALQPGPFRRPALLLLLQLLEPEPAQQLLRHIAQAPADIRLLIRGAGFSGDAHYVPWLLKQMRDPQLSRLAAESFTLICGADLVALQLECPAPADEADAAGQDPQDDNVAMDEDDNLPWPHTERVQAWWSQNAQHFMAGTRYFLGVPPNEAHCLGMLREGQQRQRRLAADRLCLVRPGTPLFNIAAPAWRQQRLLENMT